MANADSLASSPLSGGTPVTEQPQADLTSVAALQRLVGNRAVAELLTDRAPGIDAPVPVQRQQPVTLPAPQAVIDRLDRMLLPIFFGSADGTFSVDGLTRWMETFTQLIDDAKAAAAGSASAELVRAVDRAVALFGADMRTAAEEVRSAAIQLTNSSSVANKNPATAVFPTDVQAKRFGAAAARFAQLARDPALPAGNDARAMLQSVAATGQDGALAILQSLSVVNARDRWKTGTSTETPSPAKAGSGPRTKLDEIFKDAGWSDRVSKDEKGRIYDWCGMFVVSSYFKGAGLAEQLRGGFYHVDNVKDFFNYEQLHNAGRAPMSIWAENQWWNLRDYHRARGSLRQWTPRDDIRAALAAGGAADIRPGDTLLIDHKGGNKPSHIVMVESYNVATKQLVTIEGNTFGIHAGAGGAAERVDDEHLKKSKQGSGTATGLHVRDLSTLLPAAAPVPGTYFVIDPAAYVRDEANLTKTKKEGGKPVAIPIDTEVNVTEFREQGGARFANVEGFGWTKLGNLGKSRKPPKDAYTPVSGATVWGAGRPSYVDFEDGHEYAVNQVPELLKTTSPDEMRELAKKKDKTGAAAKKVGVK